MCKEVKDGAKPDLEFYYNVNDVIITNKDGTNVENTISQNTIYLDRDLKIPIGNYLFDYLYGVDTSFGVSNASVAFDAYTNLEGGFQASNITKSSSSSTIIPANSVIIYNIYAGNGSFLGASGNMIIITDETPIRNVLVYFAK